MNQTKLFGVNPIAMIATVVAMSALGSATQAHAKITAFLSAGTTCEGKSSAGFATGGPAVKVSLCVTTTNERLCGHTTKLQAAEAAENARFQITAVIRGPNYSDPNGEPLFPVAVTNPPAISDFGATVSSAAVAPMANQLMATFDLSPQANATADVYTVRLAPISSVGVSADGTCTLPTDSSISASFTLIRRSDKESRK